MNELTFAYPYYFWLLLITVPIIVWYILKKRKSQATIRFSSTESFENDKISVGKYLRHILFVLRILVISLFIVILARPQAINHEHEDLTKGIDIILALDISSSMLARDFRPNRLEASKDLAIKFISGRRLDRIGLVVFSGETFTQCPLTVDHAVLINLFQDIKQGLLEDGTAIGIGLANAVNRLKNSEAISRVVILLTDGVNNSGEISPITAADLAAKYGIRVYTIGVGKNGYAPYPVQTSFGVSMQQMEVEIDEKTLKIISEKTGGQYFRATNNNKLKQIYDEIDKLEKSKIEVLKYNTKEEKYLLFAALAGLLLFIEIILRITVFRNIS